jgi:predicted enzyme related to lactoylglutathione lyase
VTILVRDQEEALGFYADQLGFAKLDDVVIEGFGRWLTVRPPCQPDVMIALQQATESEQELVGRNAMWAFTTDDCQGDYEAFRARGVQFLQEPLQQPWGVEALFEDVYGNPFSLLQPAYETYEELV